MHVLILTFGTRGDIEPFAAFAERLAHAGHSAVLAAPEPYRSTVSNAGFEPMATEMDRVMRVGMTRLNGPMHALSVAREMGRAMRVSLQEQWNIAERTQPTVVIAHPKALGGLHVAERLGVPFAASLPLPFLTPTRAFPIPFMARPLTGPLNRATYQFNRVAAAAYGGMINTFRRDTLRLARMSRLSTYLSTRDGAPVPVLYPFSRHVVPVPADYPASAHVTGYWFGETSTTWEPPRDLADFLHGPRPVVYVGFGSMGLGGNAQERGRLIDDAVRRAGVRAVVSAGWGAVSIERREHIYPVHDIPHEWLFPRVDAVVHHGGSGTAAAGLRAGKPTLVCPVLGDQPFWARRLHELGVGPRPIPLRRVTPESLTEKIAGLVSDPGYAARAAAISARIAIEDGPGEAIRVLEDIELRASGRHG